MSIDDQNTTSQSPNVRDAPGRTSHPQQPASHVERDKFPLDAPITDEDKDQLRINLAEWGISAQGQTLRELRLMTRCVRPSHPLEYEVDSNTGGQHDQSLSGIQSASQLKVLLDDDIVCSARRPRPKVFDNDLEGAKVEIIRTISANVLGQVYEGFLTIGNAAERTRVALKIHQISLSDVLQSLEHDYMAHIDWIRIVAPFRREKWAYERMAALQGLFIPHIAGFYQMTFPSGEPAVVLVMEYVESALPPVLSGMAEEDVIEGLVRGIVAVLQAMHTCDVVQSDPSWANFLWPRFNEASPVTKWLPVAIDFNITRIPSCNDRAWALRHALCDQGLKYGLTGSKIVNHVKKLFNERPDLADWFSPLDGDLSRISEILSTMETMLRPLSASSKT